MAENYDVEVFELSITLGETYIQLPTLFVEAPNNFDSIDGRDIKKYIKKSYPQSYLKQIVIDAIENGYIPLKVEIDDTDRYESKDVDKDNIVSLEEFYKTVKKNK